MCGIFSYSGKPPKPSALANAVATLRHRGTVGFGFWWQGKSGQFANHRESEPGHIPFLPSKITGEDGVFIAHWRYSTAGSGNLEAVQPLIGRQSNFVLAHNGQFLLPLETQKSDTEIVFSRLAANLPDSASEDAIGKALNQHDGAFSIVLFLNGKLIIARDTHGFRPLFTGKYAGGVAVSSETTALEAIRCEAIKELPAGHWARLEPRRNIVSRSYGNGRKGLCAFEHIYFHSCDGKLSGKPVSEWRRKLGVELAHEKPVSADFVAPIPNSGCDATQGYASELKIPFVKAIERTKKAERTFIASSKTREQKLSEKYLFHTALIEDKHICIVDDSVVRGTTLSFLNKQLRAAGARSVHARIAAPKFQYPCYFGIDVPSQSELAVHRCSSEELAGQLGLDSLEFLSVSSLHRALDFHSLCTGCFTSRYPISISEIRRKTEVREANTASYEEHSYYDGQPI